MAATFCSLVLVMLSTFLHRPAETVPPMTDWNRVMSAFNRSHDPCRDVSEFMGCKSKAVADGMCEEAFKALDRLRLNTCVDWGDAKCRFIGEDQRAQCTCKISLNKDHSVTSDRKKTFRECAQDLRMRDVQSGQALVSINSQEIRSSHDNPGQASSSRLQSNYPGLCDSAGRDNGVETTSAASSSSGVPIHTTEGTSNPWDVYISGFKDPSSQYPSYAPGTSGTKIPEPRKKRSIDLNRVPRPHECDDCEGSFVSARSLLMHKKIYHTVRDSHCDNCNFTYSNRKNFFRHLRKRHADIAAQVKASRTFLTDQDDAEAILPFACEFCPKRYSEHRGLVDHKKSHTTEDTKCSGCTRTFSTRASLKTHMQSTHPFMPIPQRVGVAGSQKLVCGDCGKLYKTKKSLRSHEKSHNTLDTYCGFCDRTLTTKDTYRSHIKRWHPEFAKSEAEKAKRQYIEENPHACEKCDKRFKKRRGLREHKPIHDGETKCDECDTVLPRKSALAAHKKNNHPK